MLGGPGACGTGVSDLPAHWLLEKWEAPCCSQERAAPSKRQTLPGTHCTSHGPIQAVLDQENPDLFKWLTGQEEAPSDMLANSAFIVSFHVPLFWCCAAVALYSDDAACAMNTRAPVLVSLALGPMVMA